MVTKLAIIASPSGPLAQYDSSNRLTGMSARETAVTFAVDDARLESTAKERSPAVTVAHLVAEQLTAAGVACSEPEPFAAGARFAGRVGRREVPLLVGPAPEHLVGSQPRWFLSIGSSVMPLARLIGAKDVRTTMTDAITAALDAAPGVRDVRWHDEESWAGRPARRRWLGS